MDTRDSLLVLNQAQKLADSGRHAALLQYLRGRDRRELDGSPTLALLYGMAQGRLGRHDEGARWVEAALTRARERGDTAIEARALNIGGAIALERGRINEAGDYFLRALGMAKQYGDHATVGRCSNNLGIIANLRGHHSKAVSWYTMAQAAFERAGVPRGLAETQNNLRITYRDQGELVSALEAAHRAVDAADRACDPALKAHAMAGRAEVRVLSDESRIARREIEWALSTHRSLQDVVGEAEDLRVLAATQMAAGELPDAERTLRDVIERAEKHGRPLLVAEATRDLATLCVQLGRRSEARDLAHTARALFARLGAHAEVHKLDVLTPEMA